jgi:hypothetical protein
VIYDIPPTARELPEALPPQLQLANGIKQGTNGFDKIGFAGPCPPGNSAHRYELTVYAWTKPLTSPVVRRTTVMMREVLRRILRGFFVASERRDDVAARDESFGRQPQKRTGDTDDAGLDVLGAAAEEIAVFLDKSERIALPV